MRALVLSLSLLALLACAPGCGPSTPSATGPGGGSASATRQAFPVLDHVPPNATYAFVTPRTADFLTGLRELIAAFGLVGDFEVVDLEAELTRNLGINFLAAAELSDAGIAVDASAAIFSTELLPTILVPVADDARLDAFLAAHSGGHGEVRRVGAIDVHSHRFDDDAGVHWARVHGWLAIRFAVRMGRDPAWMTDMGWIEAIAAAGAGADLGDADDVAQILADASARLSREPAAPPMIGAVRFAALVDAIRAIAPPDTTGCWNALGVVRGTVGVGVAADWNRADAFVALPLAPSAARALRGAATPPPAGLVAFRENAGLRGGWSLDPAWLDGAARESGCLPLAEMLPWQRPEPGTPISLHGALESFDPGSFEGRVAVHLGLRDDRMVREALDRLPQRKSFERSRQIGDVAVKDVKVPLMVSFTYRLMPSVFTVAMGKGVMEQVLAAPQPAPEPLELASLAIYPQRLPNLDEILTMVAEGIGVGRRIAHRMAGRLARYEHGQIGLTLDGDTLVFSAGMALAGGR